MIDMFSLLLTHGVIFLTCWRLLGRGDLDDESGGEKFDFRGKPRGEHREKGASGDA